MMYCTTQGHTQTGIPSVYTPYVHWKMMAYQNDTPAVQETQHNYVLFPNELTRAFRTGAMSFG